MQELCKFLLQLHGAARDVPFVAFQEQALLLLKSLVPFDAARWGTTRHDLRGADFHAPYLYNESPEAMDEYNTYRESDRAGRWCLMHLGTVGNFQLPELFANDHAAGLWHYAQRYRHMHALIVGCKSGDDGLFQAISLYRAYANRPFDETQRMLLEIIFPHLTEALQTSLTFHLERIRPRGSSIWALAICDKAGDFRLADAHFRELLHEEWPNLQTRCLPLPLIKLLNPNAPSRYQGRATVFLIEVLQSTVFVRARARLPVDALSQREREVAELVIAGLTHKEIARSLTLAPATVRNHLQAIHDRAGVHNNAELAEQLRRASA
jgi:DNA-binding CsgD family transcriptional regulator